MLKNYAYLDLYRFKYAQDVIIDSKRFEGIRVNLMATQRYCILNLHMSIMDVIYYLIYSIESPL